MDKCVWCNEAIAKNADYFFYWKGQKVIIEPGFKFPLNPSICPKCLSLRIQKYVDERKSFVEKFIEIKNNEISVNMKNFWEACRHPNAITEDGYGWDVEDFWWAVGIVTAQNKGYRFNWDGEHIDTLRGRQGYYSFVSKEVAIDYVKHEFESTGVKTTRGICLITEYIPPEEIF